MISAPKQPLSQELAGVPSCFNCRFFDDQMEDYAYGLDLRLLNTRDDVLPNHRACAKMGDCLLRSRPERYAYNDPPNVVCTAEHWPNVSERSRCERFDPKREGEVFAVVSYPDGREGRLRVPIAWFNEAEEVRS